MYIVRDIFHLKFGHFKEANALLKEAMTDGMMPSRDSARVLSDFTGDSYRLIFEEGFDSLAEFEKALGESMAESKWQKWYEGFKQHVDTSQREILKTIQN